MKIRTLAQLDLYLDSISGWRKKELTSLRFTVGGAKGDQQRMLLRAAVTLLYAHWEGFVKDAAAAYVQFTASQKLSIGELSDSFMALALRRQIRMAGLTGKTSAHIQLVHVFTKGLTDRAKVPWRRAINTEANLRGRVFKEIILTVGLDFAPYALKMKPVVDRLVDLRNGVAHGRGIPVDETEYVNLHAETIALVDAFKTDLSDAAASRRYSQ